MNIAIIGSGPAGLASALALSRRSYDVEIFERFDTPRPVGSGIILQPTGLAVLRELGLTDAIHAVGQRIDLMHGVSMPSGKTVLDVNYSVLGGDFHGLAVHRAALFDVLFGAVQRQNVKITTGVQVVGITGGHKRAVVDARGGEYGAFDLVIDASGARSCLRDLSLHSTRVRQLDYGALWGAFDWPTSVFDSHTLHQRYVGAHTMIGVLPIGQHASASVDQVAFFWSIKARHYDTWRAQGLDAWKDHVRSIWPATEPILKQIVEPAQMMLATYGHVTMRTPFGNRIVFVGDAAHSTSPQLGQGANMALLDAHALVEALGEGVDLDSAAQRYAKVRRWHVRAFQLSSLALTSFYQSDSRVLAGLRDLLFDPVSKLPVARQIVAGLISGMLGGPPKGLGLRKP